MPSNSAPKETTTTVKNEVPEYLRPYSETMLTGAAALGSLPQNPYPGAMFAPITPEQQMAQYMTQRRAVQGSPAVLAAQQQVANTAGQMQQPQMVADELRNTFTGGYQQEGNPYLSEAIRLAQNEQIPSIGFMSRQGGSYGNTGISEAAARNMGNIAANMRYANYGDERNRQMQALQTSGQLWDAERNRQMQAASLAPGLAQEDYRDAQMLMGVGDARRGYQQEILDYTSGAWDAAQQWPYSQMDWFSNILRGAGFGTGFDSSSTAPNPYQSNPMATAIGAGATLGSFFDILSKR